MSGEGLGNIFDAVEQDAAATSGRPGPDFKVEVEVPRRSLGDPSGQLASVPGKLEVDGLMVARKLGPGEDGDGVRLHLAADFKDGATLRLRGQGGLSAQGGRPGDLYITVRIVGSAAAGTSGLWIGLAALIAAALATWSLGWLG